MRLWILLLSGLLAGCAGKPPQTDFIETEFRKFVDAGCSGDWDALKPFIPEERKKNLTAKQAKESYIFDIFDPFGTNENYLDFCSFFALADVSIIYYKVDTFFAIYGVREKYINIAETEDFLLNKFLTGYRRCDFNLIDGKLIIDDSFCYSGTGGPFQDYG